MEMTMRKARILALGMVVIAPTTALADRTSPLEGQPAIRHKMELRAGRFELTPTFEATISADFKQTYAFGAKLDYHLNDWLSVGALIFYGVDANTGLMDQIVNSLPAPGTPNTFPTPTQDQALQHANTMPLHGAVAVTFTPWAGKMGIFGKAFINYDIYIQGGLGFAQTKNDFGGNDTDTICDQNCSDPDPKKQIFNDPRNDGPHNAGFQPGLMVGGGIHLFFNGWAALDISFRDYLFTDNPGGLDYNADLQVTGDDRRFLSHLFVGVGLSMYLPMKENISR
jgi:outer membrane beta-barrel protein